jgi:hypothetical protein
MGRIEAQAEALGDGFGCGFRVLNGPEEHFGSTNWR